MYDTGMDSMTQYQVVQYPQKGWRGKPVENGAREFWQTLLLRKGLAIKARKDRAALRNMTQHCADARPNTLVRVACAECGVQIAVGWRRRGCGFEGLRVQGRLMSAVSWLFGPRCGACCVGRGAGSKAVR